MPRRLALVAAPLALAALMLGGCTAQPRIPAAEPQPTASPLFASDEEALAAATAAYEEYTSLSAAIASNPPFDPGPLAKLTSPLFFERELQFFEYLESQGLVTEGAPQVVSSQFQQRFNGDHTGELLVIYVCLDVTATRVVDAAGVDRTPPDRQDRQGVEVEFLAISRENLVLQRSEQWSDASICG